MFVKSTFQLWSQVLKIKLLHCLEFILSQKKKKTTKKLVDWSVGGAWHKSGRVHENNTYIVFEYSTKVLICRTQSMKSITKSCAYHKNYNCKKIFILNVAKSFVHVLPLSHHKRYLLLEALLLVKIVTVSWQDGRRTVYYSLELGWIF